MNFFAVITFQILSLLFAGSSDTLKLLFIGDVMQHSAQLDAAYIGKGAKNSPESYSYKEYFQYLKPFFEKADIVAANMETTFGPAPFAGYPAFCSPSSLAQEAKESGINLFFASNNHSVDRGAAGLKGTIELYEQLGIPFTGIYRDSNEESANHPLIISKKNIKIAFLNYTYGTNGIAVPSPYIVKLLDSSTVRRDLAAARFAKPDFIIVSVHWGEEYKLSPSVSQFNWESLFYANGADIVIGSHPHVPQDVVTYRDPNGDIEHITAYSLGNAISNMTAKDTRVGIMLEVCLVKTCFEQKELLQPKVHYIWTSRPAATGGYFTIVPMREYLMAPSAFGINGEHELIERYYNTFEKR
ncbi:MAG: CapA family protein [Bacteroidales bacterium]|nr:CapA family protein [Bacteroidales bacterium]